MRRRIDPGFHTREVNGLLLPLPRLTALVMPC
jgi:hypothetical protein